MSYRRVTVEAPSRLAFTLIDLGVGSDRINGGAGVALSTPSFKCQVEPSEIFTIQVSQDLLFAYGTEVTEFSNKIIETLGCPPVNLKITSAIPPHTGFGSKTATLLSVGRAIASLYDKKISTPLIAQIARRGGTSGVGVNTFDRGGFVVDGGHAVPEEHRKADDIFLPSRFSLMKTTPPVLFHSKIPWPLFIVVPVGRIVQGDIELAHFRKVCPIPRSSVHEIAYVVCFRMVSALVENDYFAFCRAVNDLQHTHWKASQIDSQTDELKYVVEHGLSNGFDAIGISSNGPALYGMSTNTRQVSHWLKKLRGDGVIKSFWQTAVAPRGARVHRMTR